MDENKVSFNWNDVTRELSQQIAELSTEKALLQAQVTGLLKERSEYKNKEEVKDAK